MTCSSSSELELNQLNFGEPFCFTAELSAASDEETTVEVEGETESFLQKHYLACMDPIAAEKTIKKAGSLALYHRQDCNTAIEVQINLSMFLVYKTTKGRCKHFAVENVHMGDRIFYGVQGDPHHHQFASLGHLVRFYTIYYLCSEDKVDALPVTE